MARNRAFTLLEALLSTALMGCLLALVAGLLQGLSRVGQRIDESGRLQEQLRAVLPIMKRECRAAVLWTSPALGSTVIVSQLHFKVPDLQQESTRFPMPIPAASPGAPFKLDDSNELLTIRYYQDSAGLWREVTQGGTTEKALVSEIVQGLSAQRIGSGQMLLQVTSLRQGNVQLFRDQVDLPLRRSQ